jgi:hypothetical protein
MREMGFPFPADFAAAPTYDNQTRENFQNGNESQEESYFAAEMGSGIPASLRHHRSFFPLQSSLNCL